jgi:outer membrane protein OmpA-like peptidoglycan-associated protein
MNSLLNRKILPLILFLFCYSASLAQKTPKKPVPNKGKKWPNVGFAYNLVDLDPSIPKEDSIYGFSAMYWQGLSKRFDISARFNGIFSNKINNEYITSDKNRMSSEIELAIHVKALRNEKAINPFLSAGIGIGNYKKDSWTRYELAGGGLQINFKNELYFLVQANYRYSLDKEELPHNTFYSVGITRSIYSKKKRNQLADQDKDGVPDNADSCPDIAGASALQGCPDQDNDGVADKDDRCPAQPGVSRYQGCPVPDIDKDGFDDETDKCPCDAGTEKYGGCPVPDADKDGINDEEDKCPNLAGVKANQGCPVVSAEVKKKVNTVAKSIFFITGSAELKSNSFRGLDEIIRIMRENPDMKLTIEGHTDDVGTDENNQRLSDNRAEAVKTYIVNKGITEERISAKGFGESKPIVSNASPAGRTQNRRVELTLGY